MIGQREVSQALKSVFRALKSNTRDSHFGNNSHPFSILTQAFLSAAAPRRKQQFPEVNEPRPPESLS